MGERCVRPGRTPRSGAFSCTFACRSASNTGSVPLTTQHYLMLARNLLYTGVTRGRRLVVLLGQRRALAMAVRNGAARRRLSKLRDWLRPDSEANATPRLRDRHLAEAEA